MLGFFPVMFTALGFSEEMESVGLCYSGGLCLSKLPEFSACITNTTIHVIHIYKAASKQLFHCLMPILALPLHVRAPE